jgi:hypothetical protein
MKLSSSNTNFPFGSNTQDSLLLNNLMKFYTDEHYLNTMLQIITGESKISLRIVDWFATNFAKKKLYGLRYK